MSIETLPPGDAEITPPTVESIRARAHALACSLPKELFLQYLPVIGRVKVALELSRFDCARAILEGMDKLPDGRAELFRLEFLKLLP